MDVEGRVAVVTGGARGIGAELANRLADSGANVIVADLESVPPEEHATRSRERIVAERIDVSTTDGLRQVLALATQRFGQVDLFVANAGVLGPPGIGEDSDWEHTLSVNALAHVRAARLLLPGWLERGEGYFVSIASAAGLLAQVGAAPYSVSKHAAVAFSEWLSIAYGEQGIKVTCVCPMGVDTTLLRTSLDSKLEDERVAGQAIARAGAIIQASEVARLTLEAIKNDEFLVLPHPEVYEFVKRKAADHDRWLRGMQRLQASLP